MRAGHRRLPPGCAASAAHRAIDGRDELGSARATITEEIRCGQAVYPLVVRRVGATTRDRSACRVRVREQQGSPDRWWRAGCACSRGPPRDFRYAEVEELVQEHHSGAFGDPTELSVRCRVSRGSLCGVECRIRNELSGLGLFDRDGKPRAALIIGNGWTGFWLKDHDGAIRAGMALDAGGPRLVVQDEAERHLVSLP